VVSLKIKIIWISLAVLFVSFGLYIAANLFGTPWGRIYYKNQMVSYLDAKYHSNFVVHNIRFNPLGSWYEATAYPKKDPSLSFTVRQSENDSFTDMYPSVYWQSTYSKQMKDYIQELFPDLDPSSYTVEPQFGELFGPHIPTLKSIHLEVGGNCLMMIKLEQNWFDLSEAQQENEREKIRKISSYLQRNHFPVFVEIFYNTETVDNTNLKVIFITESGEMVEK
jgi:hypothetical protein